jgi:hypothetical protein
MFRRWGLSTALAIAISFDASIVAKRLRKKSPDDNIFSVA